MTEIALFPIPNCVTFPGTRYPLHVFEPRYRDMIQFCLDSQTPLAVCHVEKLLRPSKPDQDRLMVLQSNQATYKPVTIVAAGPCQLDETLDDGRLMIQVNIQQRYRLLEAKQSLPFMIYECEEYPDLPMTDEDLSAARQLQDKVLHRLIALTAHMPELSGELASATWQQKSVEAFSFELGSVLQMDGDAMQFILEQRTPLERLNTALEILNSIPPSL